MADRRLPLARLVAIADPNARRPQAARLARGGAWFLVLFSLVHLGWAVVTKLDDPGAAVALYTGTVDGTVLTPPGLGYEGALGLPAAFLQAGLLAAAAVATLRPRGRSRRLGHAILIAWSAFLLAGVARLAIQAPGVDTLGQSLVLAALLPCTLYRAVSAARSTPASAGDDEPALTPDDVVAAAWIEETTTPAAAETAPPPDRTDRRAFRRRLARLGSRVVGATRPAARRAAARVARGAGRLAHRLGNGATAPERDGSVRA